MPPKNILADKLQEALSEALDKFGLDARYVEVAHNHHRPRDTYFNRVKNIYDQVMAQLENVSIEGITDEMVLTKISENASLDTRTFDPLANDFVRAEIVDVIEELGLDLSSDEVEDRLANQAENSFDGLEEHFPRIYESLMKRIDPCSGARDLDLDDHGIRAFIEQAYDIYVDDARQAVIDDEIEGLGFCTIYYEPDVFDAEAAHKCNLTPFCFEADNGNVQHLLALAGGGQDLSPKLDAYQALTVGSIDKSSMILRESDYARSLIGKNLLDEVLQRTACDPIINIGTSVKPELDLDVDAETTPPGMSM